MLKNCFISFISPGIYQCNRTSNRKKRTKFNLNVLHSILLYFMRRVHLYCTTLYIYTVRSSETQDNANFVEISPFESRYYKSRNMFKSFSILFRAKNMYSFFKILRIKILFKLFKKLLLRK